MSEANQSKTVVRFTVNDQDRQVILDHPMRRLLDVLRVDLDFTGCKEGCGEGECGACAVLMDGVLVNSCLIPAQQAQGAEILTPEGLAARPEGKLLAQCYAEFHAVQCGFCTPGMMMASASLLYQNTDPDEQRIREALAGNLCRCTGYDMIVEAVQAAARRGKDLW